MLTHPFAQNMLVNSQITGGLRHQYPALPDQFHRLGLKILAELPSSHSFPPVPKNTLSRRPGNRQLLTPPALHEEVMPFIRPYRAYLSRNMD